MNDELKIHWKEFKEAGPAEAGLSIDSQTLSNIIADVRQHIPPEIYNVQHRFYHERREEKSLVHTDRDRQIVWDE